MKFYNQLSARTAVLDLMTRRKKHEIEEVAFPSSNRKQVI